MRISIIVTKISRQTFRKKLIKKLKKPDSTIKESKTLEDFTRTLDNKDGINFINLPTMSYDNFISLYELFHKRKDKFVILFTEENRQLECKPGKFIDIYNGVYNRCDYPIIIQHTDYHEVIVTYKNEWDVGYLLIDLLPNISCKTGIFHSCLNRKDFEETMKAKSTMTYNLMEFKDEFCRKIEEKKDELYKKREAIVIKEIPKNILRDCIAIIENRLKQEEFIVIKKSSISILFEKREKNNLFIQIFIEFIHQDSMCIYTSAKTFPEYFVCYDTALYRQETHFKTDLEVLMGFKEEVKKIRFTAREELNVILDVLLYFYNGKIKSYYIERSEKLVVDDYYGKISMYGSKFS